MGKNNFTNWTSGCGCGTCSSCANNNTCGTTANCGCNTCVDHNACTDCGCAAAPVYPAHDCGCSANSCGTPSPCGCDTATSCGCHTNTCGCSVSANGCGTCGCGAQDGTHIYYETCDGFKEISITGSCQQDIMPGRVLDVNATLLNVCPGRRSALGLALTEVDENGTEYARGFQAVTVPAHNGSCNQDIHVDTVRFVLPEDQCLQSRRHFIVRTQHHYLDAASIWNNSWGGGCRR